MWSPKWENEESNFVKISYEIIGVFCARLRIFPLSQKCRQLLRDPYTLPGYLVRPPYVLPGLRPWTPRGLPSPRPRLLWSPKKILKLYCDLETMINFDKLFAKAITESLHAVI